MQYPVWCALYRTERGDRYSDNVVVFCALCDSASVEAMQSHKLIRA